MKITDFVIENFRSLQRFEMKSLGAVTLLIGPNSSGKSNILEALSYFFAHFSHDIESTVSKLDENLWYQRLTGNAIRFEISLSLSGQECGGVLTEEEYELVVGKPRLPLERGFGPSPFEESGPSIPMTIFRELTPTKWVTQKWEIGKIQLEKVDKDPTEKISNERKQQIRSALAKIIRESFEFVIASRSEQWKVGKRNPTIPRAILDDLIKLRRSRRRGDEQKTYELRRQYRELSRGRQELDFDLEVLIEERGIRFPVALVGGGNQEALRLLWLLGGQHGKIFAIEEPELHLHAQLVREVCQFLKQSAISCQLIISTHSPIIIDEFPLKSTYLIRKEAGTTTLFPITRTEDLEKVVFELGIRPSDVFLANSILFVEGPSECEFLPKIAQHLGIRLRSPYIAIVPIRGKGKTKRKLIVWGEIAQAANIPFFIILDKDAENIAEKARESRKIDRECIYTLKRGALEDYYPKDLLKSVLEKMYSINPEDLKAINELLKKPPKRWVRELGEILRQKKYIQYNSEWKIKQ